MSQTIPDLEERVHDSAMQTDRWLPWAFRQLPQPVPFSRLALASALLGMFSFPTSPFCLGVPMAVTAIATGLMARRRLHPDDIAGRRLARLGICYGAWCLEAVAYVLAALFVVAKLGPAGLLLIGAALPLVLFIGARTSPRES